MKNDILNAALSEKVAHQELTIIDLSKDQIHEDEYITVAKGLLEHQKRVSSKYFYDALGSRLFDQICGAPEYYPTRTEVSILKENATSIIRKSNFSYITELGSGSDKKISVLLDKLNALELEKLHYMPIDISESAIQETYNRLQESYPELEVTGVISDFTQNLGLVDTEASKLLCFLGSTIGNFSPFEAIQFFKSVSNNMGSNDYLLVGFDMVKNEQVLHNAYNDSLGVTERFNKNILSVLNSTYSADFNKEQFRHKAFYNKEKQQVEMHLLAKENSVVSLQDLALTINFVEGETLHTEISRKFTNKSIQDLANASNLEIDEVYTDSREWFSLVMLKRKS
jgi:L-histidine N-alpha-methyltransferase